jgi:hypothetical protein
VPGTVVEVGRMVGLIRQGRSEEVKRKPITALADAWVSFTGEAIVDIALFLHEVPGYQVMENGQLLPVLGFHWPKAVLSKYSEIACRSCRQSA